MKLYTHFKNRIFSLKTQLVVMIIFVCLAVLMIASFGSYSAIFGILRRRAEQQTVQQLRQVEYNIGTLFNEIRNVSTILLSNPNVQEFISKDTKNFAESVYIDINLLDTAENILNNYSLIHSIDILTDRGENYYLSREYNSKENEPNQVNSVYTLDIYKEVLERFPNIIWKAGTVRHSYPSAAHGNGDNALKMITALKGVKSLYINQNAVIAINVEEKYLTELYNKLTDENNTLRVYIIAGHDHIIPGDVLIQNSKRDRIIQELDTFPDIPYGHFAYKDEEDNQTADIVYYRIENMDWTLVREIPIIELSDDVLLLRRIIIMTYLFSFCIIALIAYLWISREIKPIHRLSQAMKDAGKGNFGHVLKKAPRNEIGLLINQFNTMSVNILNLLEENRKIEKEKRVQEIKTLQAQINPHFLYNTLNVIKYMAIISEAHNVANSITILGNIIRPIFKEKSTMYTLHEEIEFLKNYVEILNIRYGNNIAFQYDIDEKYLYCKIPRFILQPIIENSVIHGMQLLSTAGMIHIRVKEERDDIIIIVSDNGEGMTEEKVRELNEHLSRDVKETDDTKDTTGSIGIHNVNSRIQLHFGKQYGLSIESRKNEGARVIIKIPQVYNGQ